MNNEITLKLDKCGNIDIPASGYVKVKISALHEAGIENLSQPGLRYYKYWRTCTKVMTGTKAVWMAVHEDSKEAIKLMIGHYALKGGHYAKLPDDYEVVGTGYACHSLEKGEAVMAFHRSGTPYGGGAVYYKEGQVLMSDRSILIRKKVNERAEAFKARARELEAQAKDKMDNSEEMKLAKIYWSKAEALEA